MRHRARVVLGGWLVFCVVFLAGALVFPDPLGPLPLVVATAVTALLTPVLHLKLANHAQYGPPEET